MMSVSWPRACIGCGRTTDLEPFKYAWERTTHRPRHMEIESLGVHVFICPNCIEDVVRSAAPRKRLFGYTTLILILTSLIGGLLIPAFLDVPSSMSGAIFAAAVSWIAMFPLAAYRVYSRKIKNPCMNYFKMPYLNFIFKSAAFAEIFHSNNPGLNVEVNPNTAGSTDWRNNCIISFCCFGFVIPVAILGLVLLVFG